MSASLRIYLGIQYALNATLAIIIVSVMVLTLIKYNSTKNIQGAWPANAILSPTLLMLVVSCVNVIIDSVNLLVQCCGVKAIKAMAAVVTKVRNAMGIITTLAPAVAAGFSAFAKNTTNGSDLWGYSCSDAADQMQAVNSSGTICMSNVSLPPSASTLLLFHSLGRSPSSPYINNSTSGSFLCHLPNIKNNRRSHGIFKSCKSYSSC
jgi:hypothetical protein